MKRANLEAAAREVLVEVAPARAAELAARIAALPPGDTSAAHVTVGETTLVSEIEKLFTTELGDRAAEAIDKLAVQRTLSKIYQIFLYGTMSTADRVEDKGACSKRLAIPCPACQRTDCVDYVGSDVLEGSLEFVHLVHTEVADWFCCSRCAYSWSETHHI